MANTTQAAVLAIAAELATISQDAWDIVLADVALQVGANWGAKQEIGQRYLAAHRLTLIANKEKGAGVTSERTGDVSTSYAAPGAGDYCETMYGREFERIRRGAICGFMTVTP
jgi:hypothetical protein